MNGFRLEMVYELDLETYPTLEKKTLATINVFISIHPNLAYK